jgi:hypothetical protein
MHRRRPHDVVIHHLPQLRRESREKHTLALRQRARVARMQIRFQAPHALARGARERVARPLGRGARRDVVRDPAQAGEVGEELGRHCRRSPVAEGRRDGRGARERGCVGNPGFYVRLMCRGCGARLVWNKLNPGYGVRCLGERCSWYLLASSMRAVEAFYKVWELAIVCVTRRAGMRVHFSRLTRRPLD